MAEPESRIAPQLPQESTSLQPPLPSDALTPPPTWEETGEIADDEAIKIESIKPSSTSPRTSTGATSSKPPKKRAKKGASGRPADLLEKNTKTPTNSNDSNPAALSNKSDTSQLTIPKHAPTENPNINTPMGAQAALATIRDLEPHLSPDTPDNAVQASPTLPADSQVGPVARDSVVGNPEHHIPPKSSPSAATETNNAKAGVSNTNLAAPVEPPAHGTTTAPQPSPTNQVLQPSQSIPETHSGQANPTPSGPSNPNPSDTAAQVVVCPLTILKSVDVRIKVVHIHQDFEGSKPSWQRYQTTWASLTSLVQFCVQSMHASTPSNPEFQFQRTACSYASWIKTISSLADSFLSPSTNEQWYCPDIIEFPLLATFGNKDKSIPPQSYISTAAKTPHPKSTLVRFLYRLAHPTKTSISEWAKLVAASVEIMADSLYKPPVPTTQQSNDQIIQGVQVLQYIEAIKNRPSSFESAEENPTSDAPAPQRSHSFDVLHDFLNLILDVLSAYVIFQTHALSEPPQTEVHKKTNKRNRGATHKSSDALTPMNQESSELIQL
ncbi:hypothetical protein PtB15_12B574 [Puccinia triticina]|nr:hypothetical protein PtB15_12B574 [Puccinia triticina]